MERRSICIGAKLLKDIEDAAKDRDSSIAEYVRNRVLGKGNKITVLAPEDRGSMKNTLPTNWTTPEWKTVMKIARYRGLPCSELIRRVLRTCIKRNL